MKGIKELKARLNEDVEFKKKFCGLKDIDEMLDVARKEGYEVTMDEISCDQELTDDMLEAVAGGKGVTRTDYVNIVLSDDSTIYVPGKDNTAIKGGQK